MPGSWEIAKQRDERLLLAVICPPDLAVTLDFSQNLRNLHLPPGSEFMRVVGLPYGPARNHAAKSAIDNHYNLAFVDADMRVQPDAYTKLLSTHLDIVGGLYFQRFPPYMPCMFNMSIDSNGQMVKTPIVGWKPGDLVPCDFVPSGLTIYRLRLLSALFSKHPRPFEWGVDTSPVPSDNGINVPVFSEDYTASWRAKELGYQGHIMTDVVGLHECRAVVGPKWMIPLPSPDPYHGVVGVV